MADHISNMPCAEKLTFALREMGLVESQRRSDESHAVFGQPLNLMKPELANSGMKQVHSSLNWFLLPCNWKTASSLCRNAMDATINRTVYIGVD